MNTFTLAEAIDKLSEQSHRDMTERGFWAHLDETDTRSYLPEKLALVHSEVSEVLDADRKIENNYERQLASMEECADIILRVLDLAYPLSGNGYLSLGEIIVAKQAASYQRGHLHGKRW